MEKIELTPEQIDSLKNQIKADLNSDQQAAVERALQEGGAEQLKNVAGILTLSRKFKDQLKDVVDLEKEASTFAFELKASERQFSDFIINKMQEQKPANQFEPTPRERNRFSISKLLLSAADPIKYSASFERGLCEEYAKERGIISKGISIPKELLTGGQRTMNVASATAGGNLKGTNLLGSEMIPLARNRALADQLGVRVLPNLVGDIAIPTQTGAITAGWMSDESTGESASDMTVGQKTMNPKTLNATTSFSRRLLLQSTPQVDGLIEEDLQQVVRLGRDKALFHGTGTTQPTGIIATSGVGLGTVKTSWTLAEIIAMETAVADANLDVETMAYVTTPTIKGTLKGTSKVSGQNGFIWEGNDVNGYRAFATKQITAGFVVFGDFNQAVIGEWGGLDIVVDPYTSKAGLVYVTAYFSMDVALRYAGAFAFYKPS
jgi:HK97 family phage major capsid protein